MRGTWTFRYPLPKTRSEHVPVCSHSESRLVTVFDINTGRPTRKARNGLRYHQFVAKLLAFQRELVLARDVGGHAVAGVETTPAGNTVYWLACLVVALVGRAVGDRLRCGGG